MDGEGLMKGLSVAKCLKPLAGIADEGRNLHSIALHGAACSVHGHSHHQHPHGTSSPQMVALCMPSPTCFLHPGLVQMQDGIAGSVGRVWQALAGRILDGGKLLLSPGLHDFVNHG